MSSTSQAQLSLQPVWNVLHSQLSLPVHVPPHLPTPNNNNNKTKNNICDTQSNTDQDSHTHTHTHKQQHTKQTRKQKNKEDACIAHNLTASANRSNTSKTTQTHGDLAQVLSQLANHQCDNHSQWTHQCQSPLVNTVFEYGKHSQHWWTLCLSMANIHNTGEHRIWLWVWQTFTTLVNTVYEYGKHSQHWWTLCMSMTKFTTLVNTVYEYGKHSQHWWTRCMCMKNIHNTGEHCVRIRQTFTITHCHSQHPTRCLWRHCTWCSSHASCLPTTALGNTSGHPAHNQSTQWNITLALAQPVNNSSREYLWLF